MNKEDNEVNKDNNNEDNEDDTTMALPGFDIL